MGVEEGVGRVWSDKGWEGVYKRYGGVMHVVYHKRGTGVRRGERERGRDTHGWASRVVVGWRRMVKSRERDPTDI